jgi:uncharacterized membrane protein YsdA (DUF1294 family)
MSAMWPASGADPMSDWQSDIALWCAAVLGGFIGACLNDVRHKDVIHVKVNIVCGAIGAIIFQLIVLVARFVFR